MACSIAFAYLALTLLRSCTTPFGSCRLSFISVASDWPPCGGLFRKGAPSVVALTWKALPPLPGVVPVPGKSPEPTGFQGRFCCCDRDEHGGDTWGGRFQPPPSMSHTGRA